MQLLSGFQTKSAVLGISIWRPSSHKLTSGLKTPAGLSTGMDANFSYGAIGQIFDKTLII